MLRPLSFSLLFGLLALTACSNFKEQVGIARKAPDEFTVVTRPPLSMPPNFALRPPRPGEKGPQDLLARDQARNVLVGRGASVTAGGDTSLAAQSAGETALLAHARAETADPNIRQIVGGELGAGDDRNFVERLMFWIDVPPPGDVVDARREQQRLQENVALGKPVTTGDTPTIERKPTNRGITLF